MLQTATKQSPKTILIVEDNEIELENVRTLLESFEDHQIIGSADTIAVGLRIANCLRPDIILLDIQLQGGNSLDHIGALEYQPYIVCSTLYTKHALQAFEVGATDYLTKPITLEKLTRALNRIPTEHPQPQSNENKTAILLRSGAKSEKVPIELIVLITADRDYTTVKDEKNSTFISTRRMREWNKLLCPELFLMLDRSTIVNRKQISSYTRTGIGRTATITFLNGEEHQIGSTAHRRLREMLEL